MTSFREIWTIYKKKRFSRNFKNPRKFGSYPRKKISWNFKNPKKFWKSEKNWKSRFQNFEKIDLIILPNRSNRSNRKKVLNRLDRFIGQRINSHGAEGARHAHKFDFSVRISYKFPISNCRGDSDLGLCTSCHIAYRMVERSGQICFQQVNQRNSEPIRALHSCIIFARWQELHRRQACSALQIDTGNLYDIHTE